MQEAKHAILMTPNAQGWVWEVIDIDGVTTATGVSAHQEGAMESAWRAARPPSPSVRRDFPDIVIGYPAGPTQGAFAQARRRL